MEVWEALSNGVQGEARQRIRSTEAPASAIRRATLRVTERMMQFRRSTRLAGGARMMPRLGFGDPRLLSNWARN
jgi:hypothetical protein